MADSEHLTNKNKAAIVAKFEDFDDRIRELQAMNVEQSNAIASQGAKIAALEKQVVIMSVMNRGSGPTG